MTPYSWQWWWALRSKQQPFPYLYALLIRRVTGQPAAWLTLGEMLRVPRLIRRGVRFTSMLLALILGLLSPFLVIIVLIAFAISFLIAPVLAPVFVTLLCIEMAMGTLRAVERVRDEAVICTLPAGRSGLLWVCALNSIARRSLLVGWIFAYASLLGLAFATGIVPFGDVTTARVGSPVFSALLVGVVVGVFLVADLVQTAVLGFQVAWLLYWTRVDNNRSEMGAEAASSARLLCGGLLLLVQASVYAISLLVYLLFPPGVGALLAAVGANLGARELLVLVFGRALRQAGTELHEAAYAALVRSDEQPGLQAGV